MLSTLFYPFSRLFYHLWTLFLFTKSDIKTTVIPIVRPQSSSLTLNTGLTESRYLQTVLACAGAPISELAHLPHIVFWIWFHVLQFDVSNQTLKPEEDEYNKRDRPLPAKRITWQNALVLRWVLVPCCWLLSACYSIETVYASMTLCFLTWIYDEAGFAAGHWLGRNVVNAMGFASFEVGATLIAGKKIGVLRSHRISKH